MMLKRLEGLLLSRLLLVVLLVMIAVVFSVLFVRAPENTGEGGRLERSVPNG